MLCTLLCIILSKSDQRYAQTHTLSLIHTHTDILSRSQLHRHVLISSVTLSLLTPTNRQNRPRILLRLILPLPSMNMSMSTNMTCKLPSTLRRRYSKAEPETPKGSTSHQPHYQQHPWDPPPPLPMTCVIFVFRVVQTKTNMGKPVVHHRTFEYKSNPGLNAESCS